MKKATKPKTAKKPVGRPPLLDPEIVFAACRAHGTYTRAAHALAAAGVKNPATGRPFTKHAIRYSATRAAGYQAWAKKARAAREKEMARLNADIARIAAKPAKPAEGKTRGAQ